MFFRCVGASSSYGLRYAFSFGSKSHGDVLICFVQFTLPFVCLFSAFFILHSGLQIQKVGKVNWFSDLCCFTIFGPRGL